MANNAVQTLSGPDMARLHVTPTERIQAQGEEVRAQKHRRRRAILGERVSGAGYTLLAWSPFQNAVGVLLIADVIPAVKDIVKYLALWGSLKRDAVRKHKAEIVRGDKSAAKDRARMQSLVEQHEQTFRSRANDSGLPAHLAQSVARSAAAVYGEAAARSQGDEALAVFKEFGDAASAAQKKFVDPSGSLLEKIFTVKDPAAATVGIGVRSEIAEMAFIQVVRGLKIDRDGKLARDNRSNSVMADGAIALGVWAREMGVQLDREMFSTPRLYGFAEEARTCEIDEEIGASAYQSMIDFDDYKEARTAKDAGQEMSPIR